MALTAKEFEGGVHWYTRCRMDIEVAFPKDMVQCRYCKYCRSDANGLRYKCGITNNILFDLLSIPDECPVDVENGVQDQHEQY